MSNDLYNFLTEEAVKRKTQVNFTVDEEVVKTFNKIIKAKKLKKSHVVEKLIKLFNEQEQSLKVI